VVRTEAGRTRRARTIDLIPSPVTAPSEATAEIRAEVEATAD
jgi:hypothetical protein